VASDFGFKIAESFVNGGRSLAASTISPLYILFVQVASQWLDPKSDQNLMQINLSSALNPTSSILWLEFLHKLYCDIWPAEGNFLKS
jgi:hypothetical protein